MHTGIDADHRQTTRRDARPSAIELRYGTVFLARGTTVSIDGTSARSRLTRRLIEAFQVTPGLALDPQALAAEVWPGAPEDDSTRGRLKVAVHRLRAVGLPVMTVGRGYAIDPRATFLDVAQPGGRENGVARM